MILSYSHGREFIEQIRPILDRGDADALLRHLRQHWPAESLRGLLACGHEDAICAALVGLSLVGTMRDCPAVAAFLQDDDGLTADLAENALWSIWFRAGGADANERLALAVKLISRSELGAAVDLITGVLSSRPDYAEAYHQLSLIFFLRGDYRQAILNCRATLLLNPWHFGAVSTLGHCYAAQCRLDEACAAYQRALQLHPRLQGVRQAIHQIRTVTHPTPVNSFTNF